MALWKQFEHEKSNSRDKTKKPDYREDFSIPVAKNVLESGFSSALSSLGLRFSRGSLTRTPLWYQELSRKWKDQTKREMRRITNRFPIIIQGKKFTYKWSMSEFALANSIDLSEAKLIFNQIRTEAFERRKLVETAIARSELQRKKNSDENSQREIEDIQLSFELTRTKKIFEFADGFDIESEFFSRDRKDS
jgi:hypothetical protein